MADGGIRAQSDKLVQEQLKSINEKLGELRAGVVEMRSHLDVVRMSEVSSIRGELAKHEAELKLLRYQMGRTSGLWSLIGGGVASAIVAAVMAILLRH